MAFNYFEHELRKITTAPGESVRVKFHTDSSETRTLLLSPELFVKIEALMINSAEAEK